MAAPVVASVASANGTSSYTVARPTGTVDGDLLIGIVASDWNTLANNNITTGTWTDLTTSDYDGGTNQMHVALKAKIAASEPANYTVSIGGGADSVAAILRVTGHDGTPVIVQVAPTVVAAGTGASNAPSLTPSGADDLLICIGAVDGANGGGALTWSDTAGGLTEHVDRQSNTWTSLKVGSLANPSSPSGTKTLTPTSPTSHNNGAACTISIKSAGGGAVTGSGAAVAAPGGVAGAGTVEVAGSGATVAVAADVAGTVVVLVVGAGATTAEPAALSGSGAVTVSATGQPTAPAGFASGDGATLVTGQGSATAAAPAAGGVGGVLATGSGAATAPAAVAAGAGTVTVAGTGAVAAPATATSGSADVVVEGAGAAEAPAATVAGSGNIGEVPVTGSGAVSAPAAVVDGAGTTSVSGGGSAQASPAAASGAGLVFVDGNGVLVTATTIIDGSGAVVVTGVGSAVSPAAVVVGATVPAVEPGVPPDRVLFVAAEYRRLVVPAEARVTEIAGER